MYIKINNPNVKDCRITLDSLETDLGNALCTVFLTDKIMDKYEKLKKKFAGGKPLTDEEVQELRDKAKKYRDSGGEYLERCETK